jgi:glycosyltransferase involved in cell wall biosynthesis
MMIGQYMKTAILVDSLANRGGIERIVLEQARIFDADIYSGRYDPEKTFPEFKSMNVKQIVGRSGARPAGILGSVHTLYIWYKFSSLRLKGYDRFIFHGAASLNAAKNHKPNLWYCHSPSRYLYDLHKEVRAKMKFPMNIFFELVTGLQKHLDQKNVRHITKIAVNSKNVQSRVKKYYHRSSIVVYPFVDTESYRWISQEDYYLSAARLDPIKRIDLIIKAFLQMKKKLIIASDGPDKARLMEIAKGSDNITFLGYVSEAKLRELYGKCIATIYLSHKEDFGMIPIESMSAGKPCIATNEGGFKETIIPERTGFLVDNPEDTAEVIKAVERATPIRCLSMRHDCEKRAKSFDLAFFTKRSRQLMDELPGINEHQQ